MSRAAALYYNRKRRREVLGAEANASLFTTPATVGTNSGSAVTLLGDVYLALRSSADGTISVTDGTRTVSAEAVADEIHPIGFFRKGTSLYFSDTVTGTLEILARRYHDDYQPIGEGTF